MRTNELSGCFSTDVSHATFINEMLLLDKTSPLRCVYKNEWTKKWTNMLYYN